jgi:hypothetical protein
MEAFDDIYPRAQAHVLFVLDALAEADEPLAEEDES